VSLFDQPKVWHEFLKAVYLFAFRNIFAFTRQSIMKMIHKILFVALLLSGLSPVVRAQVKFKLSRSGPALYKVSLVADKSLTSRQAITGTMQVSLKVKSSEGFTLSDIVSLQPDVEWDNGSVVKSPDGARDYDYISLAMRSIGTKVLPYEAGLEVPLFTFRTSGVPVASVQLIDNESDPLVKTRQNRFNVRNHISVLGFGPINAYTGNIRDDSKTSQQVILRQLFPNPATTRVTVIWDNYLNGYEGEVKLGISESGNGREVLKQTEFMRQGSNKADLNVTELSTGVYLVHLEKEGERIGESLKLLIVR